MTKAWLPLCVAILLVGCKSAGQGVPIVDGSIPPDARQANTEQTRGAASQSDNGVVVMVPPERSSQPIQSMPDDGQQNASVSETSVASMPKSISEQSPSGPSGIPSENGSAGDEQLDGAVLALLTTAQQQKDSGDLNSSASSLERALRIAPREPQVLYKLAEVQLVQGNAKQAEQFARRGLSFAGGRPDLQAGLWELVAQALEKQGDTQGAEQARQQARVQI